MTLTVPIKKLTPAGKIPTCGTQHSSGYDVYATEDFIIQPGEIKVVDLHIAIAIPQGYCAMSCPRSGLARKKGLTIINGPGIVDADYRGELSSLLINHGTSAVEVKVGDRINQLVFIKTETIAFLEVEELDATQRGTGGFGSTGN